MPAHAATHPATNALPGALAALALAALMWLAATISAQAQPLVEPDWLGTHLRDRNLVVLDIRGGTAYAAGHIAGAVNADYEHAGWRAVLPDGSGGALPPVDHISVIIGQLGVGDGDHAVIVADDFGAAARVYWTFRVLGHDSVSILDGGTSVWRTAGLPMATEASLPRQATFTPHYNDALRADLPMVSATLASGSATLLDARPASQWLGQTKTAAVARFGHLPNATWIDQSSALQPDGRLKPAAELAVLFDTVAAGKPVVAYCNTGHLAATDWFVLSEILHHPDVRLYDASLSQWTHDPARPMVREVSSP